jgi:hypothetical protein
MLSTVVIRYVALVKTDISEVYFAFISRMTKIGDARNNVNIK